MHAAIFVPSLVGGGAERAMVNLAAGLTGSGHVVDLVVATDHSFALEASLPPTAKLIRLDARRTLGALLVTIRSHLGSALTGEPSPGRRWTLRAARLVDRHATAIGAVSTLVARDAEQVLRLPAWRIVTLPNPIFHDGFDAPWQPPRWSIRGSPRLPHR